MRWVLDNFQVLIVIAAAVFAILQKFKRVRTPEADAAAPAEDPEQAERTRRIQEEIRRRIMERRGLIPAPPEATEAEPSFPAAPPVIEEVRPVLVVPPPPRVAVAAAEEHREWERQQALQQQLRALEAARAAAERAGAADAAASAQVTGRSGALLADLRNPAGLRRAVVLREILGPPVALR